MQYKALFATPCTCSGVFAEFPMLGFLLFAHLLVAGAELCNTKLFLQHPAPAVVFLLNFPSWVCFFAHLLVTETELCNTKLFLQHPAPAVVFLLTFPCWVFAFCSLASGWS